MTTYRTHRAPKAAPLHPVERSVVAALVVAALVGIGWLGSMIYTIAAWSMD
ncbi:morphogenic membrane protein MmpA [Streptomyces sp. SYSU K217416]